MMPTEFLQLLGRGHAIICFPPELIVVYTGEIYLTPKALSLEKKKKSLGTVSEMIAFIYLSGSLIPPRGR